MKWKRSCGSAGGQRGNGSMLGEATLDVLGTFLGEAIRLLILFAAQHPVPRDLAIGPGDRGRRDLRPNKSAFKVPHIKAVHRSRLGRSRRADRAVGDRRSAA